ncbi:hypothetical protein C8Q78DRAFT_410666 [Trametes maxima]|nr:hypothetical protein C8Q78DRAFT_410666 [Trametes maxima]
MLLKTSIATTMYCAYLSNDDLQCLCRNRRAQNDAFECMENCSDSDFEQFRDDMDDCPTNSTENPASTTIESTTTTKTVTLTPTQSPTLYLPSSISPTTPPTAPGNQMTSDSYTQIGTTTSIASSLLPHTPSPAPSQATSSRIMAGPVSSTSVKSSAASTPSQETTSSPGGIIQPTNTQTSSSSSNDTSTLLSQSTASSHSSPRTLMVSLSAAIGSVLVLTIVGAMAFYIMRRRRMRHIILQAGAAEEPTLPVNHPTDLQTNEDGEKEVAESDFSAVPVEEDSNVLPSLRPNRPSTMPSVFIATSPATGTLSKPDATGEVCGGEDLRDRSQSLDRRSRTVYDEDYPPTIIRPLPAGAPEAQSHADGMQASVDARSSVNGMRSSLQAVPLPPHPPTNSYAQDFDNANVRRSGVQAQRRFVTVLMEVGNGDPSEEPPPYHPRQGFVRPEESMSVEGDHVDVPSS